MSSANLNLIILIQFRQDVFLNFLVYFNSKCGITLDFQLEHTYSEYKIMGTIPTMEFLVNLLSFGQDNGYLYMAFEFVPGGELFSLLRSVGRIPEITATFYGAQVVIPSFSRS